MRSGLVKRLEAVEAKVGQRRKKHPREMTDHELWEALDYRDPVTGALRTDVPDEELEARLEQLLAGRAAEGDRAG